MIVPTGHHVIVKPDPVEEVSKGGIVVTANNDLLKREQAATVTGTIVAIGVNAWKAFDDSTPWAKVGDRVYYTKHVSKVVKDPETQEELFLMTDDNILAIIK